MMLYGYINNEYPTSIYPTSHIPLFLMLKYLQESSGKCRSMKTTNFCRISVMSILKMCYWLIRTRNYLRVKHNVNFVNIVGDALFFSNHFLFGSSHCCVCVDIFPNINSPSCYFRNPSTPDPATSPNSVLRPRGRGAASSAALKTRCRWRPPGRVRLESLGCQVDWDLFLGVKLGRLQNFEGVGVSNHFKTGKKRHET